MEHTPRCVRRRALHDISWANLLGLAGALCLALTAPSTVLQAQNTGASRAPAANAGKAGHKRALLVAVVGYKRPGARSASSVYDELDTLPDVEALKEQLIRHFGFEEKEILVLNTPQTTTHRSIVDAFRSHLIQPTERGDIVYFHFSGHGSQVPNDDSHTGNIFGVDKDPEMDGLDETLVPSDYVSKDYQEKACNDIRDDEIGILLDDLAKKQPSDVFLTFDCCHSGDIRRGGRMLVRGQQWPGRRDNLPIPPAGTRGRDEGAGAEFAEAISKAAREFVTLSAARSDQLDAEAEDDNGKLMGSLSYGLAAAMARANPNTSYRDLVADVTTLMARKAPNQEPQCEGKIDVAIFNGSAVRREPTIPVTLAKSAKGDPLLILKAGYLQEMVAGTKVKILRPGQSVQDDGIAVAELEAVDTISSSLKIADAAQRKAALDAFGAASGKVGADAKAAVTLRAVVTERRYSDKPLLVDLDLPPNQAQRAPLVQLLRELETAKVARLAAAPSRAGTGDVKWDVQITPDKVPGRLKLWRQDGDLIRGDIDPSAPRTADDVRSVLEGEVRRQLFTGLENEALDDSVKVELRLVPVEVTVQGSGRSQRITSWKEKPVPENARQLSATVGEYVLVQVRNVGSQPAYATILMLGSDGTIGAIWPYPGFNVNNLLTFGANTPPDKRPWFTPKRPDNDQPFIFQFTEPAGHDLYRVIATLKDTDFSPLIDTASLQRGGGAPVGDTRGTAQTPLGRLMLLGAANKRGIDLVTPPSGWSTSTFNVFLAPKKGG